jgi:hypothetical protein
MLDKIRKAYNDNKRSGDAKGTYFELKHGKHISPNDKEWDVYRFMVVTGATLEKAKALLASEKNKKLTKKVAKKTIKKTAKKKVSKKAVKKAIKKKTTKSRATKKR